MLTVASLLASCQKEELDPSERFTKIYDSFRSDAAFYPIDVVATTTGFIILASQTTDQSSFRAIQVIELDEEGNFVRTVEFPAANYVIPIGDLVDIDSTYYFFGMEPVSLQAQLFSMTADLSDSVSVSPVVGAAYPLAASRTAAGQLLLLSYDINSQETVISTVDTDGSAGGAEGRYTIGAGNEVEPEILEHYLDPERSAQPFFCGEYAPGQVYFNGFYNFSLSLVFSGFGGSPTGVLQGQGTNGGVTCVMPVQGSNFGVFGFQYNDNFILPNEPLATSGLASSVDLLSSSVTEFSSRTPADIEVLTLDNTTYTIFAAETETRQVALYFFDTSTNELAGIHKIGYLNPYTLSSIRLDNENNLLVLGTTYVSGRFKRIFLSKIPEGDLRGIVD